MPVLTSTEIVGMFRKQLGILRLKLLFVSIAGHQIWINNILNSKGKALEVIHEETEY